MKTLIQRDSKILDWTFKSSLIADLCNVRKFDSSLRGCQAQSAKSSPEVAHMSIQSQRKRALLAMTTLYISLVSFPSVLLVKSDLFRV